MKRQLKRLLLRSRVPQAVASVGPRRVVILRYHSIQPVPHDWENTIGEGIIHSKALFAQQMELISYRFNIVTMDDIALWLQGAALLPRRAVAITFDDGFADNHESAAPILAQYGLRAAFYITTGSVQDGTAPWFCRLRSAFSGTSSPTWIHPRSRRALDIRDAPGRYAGFLEACRACATMTGDRQAAFLENVERELAVADAAKSGLLMMTWDQVLALRQSGHIIGSHTMTHPNLAHCEPDEAMRELMESKQILEDRLAGTVEHFSYPSPILEPHYSDVTTSLARQAGYVSAVTCLPGPVLRRHSPFLLPRLSAPADIDEFSWALEASLAGHIG